MSYEVFVESEQGECIVNFSELDSYGIVDFLLKEKFENRIKPEPSDCHLKQIFRLDRDIAVPFLIEELEKLIEYLKDYLDKPEGKWEWQKDLFYRYGDIAKNLENLPYEVFVFEIWDMT